MSARSPKPSLMQRLARVESNPPWTIATAALTLVFAFLIVILGTTAAYAWLGAGRTTALIGWTLSAILMAAMVWQTRAAHRPALALGAPTLPLPLVMFVSIGAAIGLDVIGLAVTGAFLPVPELLDVSAASVDLGLAVLIALFLVAAQPLGEELIFRGVALPALRSALGGWIGLILTAAASGVFHWLAYTPSYSPQFSASSALWYGLIAPSLAGLIFGIIRVATGSTRAAIAAHAAFGAFALIKFLILVG